MPPEPLAQSVGRAGTGAWLQVVLFTLLAWAAVVCTGLGGTMGVASQSLANKLAFNAQHLQRHGGPSLTSRAIRRDQTEAASVQEVVGPKVSGELAKAGVIAVMLATLAMLVYIWVGFDWPFAVGAILTLALDVVLTLGVFALTGLDFSLTAIAALLTLVGYSVNDKVVVYDRMREVIDLSINQTLTRSLYTSVTAFLAVLPLAIWGGTAVASFAVPMAVGILIAACSSVFIAAPILLFLGGLARAARHHDVCGCVRRYFSAGFDPAGKSGWGVIRWACARHGPHPPSTPVRPTGRGLTPS